MPSATSLLLNTVPAERSGTASGVLNTSRQVGGAMAIAAFGALVASLGYAHGTSLSLALAALLLIATMLASLRLRRPQALNKTATEIQQMPARSTLCPSCAG